jgi:hypothetical protein
MRKLSATAVGMALISGVTALVLAVTPALASTASSKSITGPEVLSGKVTGAAANANNPIIPLTLIGLVNTTAPKFALGNGAVKKHGVPTKVGTLNLTLAGTPSTSQSANPKTCLETFTEDVPFTVVGSTSTGVFAGASGPGAANTLRRIRAEVHQRPAQGPVQLQWRAVE